MLTKRCSGLLVACFVVIMVFTLLYSTACSSTSSTPTTTTTTPPPTSTQAVTTAPATIYPSAPPSINIGAAVPITGAQAAGGAQVQAGYQFAVDTINAAGGVFVKQYNVKIPLQLTILDDESDPTKTVSRLETLFSSNHVVAYLGGFSSALNVAGCAIGEKNKTPWLGVSFAALAPFQQGFKYIFSPFAKTPDYSAIFEALKNQTDKPTKAVVWQRQEDLGTEMGDMWKKAASTYGYQIVNYQTYAPGTTDFSSLIVAAKSAGADMVLGMPTTPEGIAMMKQMKQLDFAPKAVYLIRGADGATWGDTAEGNYVLEMPGWHSSVKYPGVDAINAWYQQKFSRPADVMVGPSYSCVQILADAIQRAGTLNPSDIRDAIAQTNMMTVQGQMSFRADGTAVIQSIDVTQWQNGKIQLVWPFEMASAKVVYPFPAWSGR
jgi:branched-chain amino acid transport system substrate-binding protein